MTHSERLFFSSSPRPGRFVGITSAPRRPALCFILCSDRYIGGFSAVDCRRCSRKPLTEHREKSVSGRTVRIVTLGYGERREHRPVADLKLLEHVMKMDLDGAV